MLFKYKIAFILAKKKVRYFIYFSYNGKSYHGWQKQKNSVTVQEKIEESLSVLLKDKIEVFGAGRTDAGVHAKQMVAHFDVDKCFENPNKLIFKLNQFLSNDISVKSLKSVKNNAHARFDAISRTYKYFINKEKDVFLNEYRYYINYSLNKEKINEAIKIIVNNKDFKCFTKSKTNVNNYICDIIDAKWIELDQEYVFKIKANRFLRNMVRSIVGTLINIGLEKTSINNFINIIKSKDRSMAGYSVPAKGLFLTKINYPKKIFK
tara:strand:+ start:107 stop:898 length:792 start_codon:yes stop_codon:yes gene_type:complete